MNTPQTWAESPVHEQIRDAGLDPVNRTTNDTPTPSQIETNAAKRPNGLRACAIGILKNPDVVIASVIMNHAADKMEQLERELAAVTEQRDEAREYADKLAEGLPDGMLPKDVEVLREANLNLATELTSVTEQRDAVTLRLGNTQERMIDAERQRDRLIKAVKPLEYWRDISECDCSCPLPQGGCLRCDLNRILEIANSQDQARP